MTVAQLIAALQQCDPNARVGTGVWGIATFAHPIYAVKQGPAAGWEHDPGGDPNEARPIIETMVLLDQLDEVIFPPENADGSTMNDEFKAETFSTIWSE